jgi:hypothetical protein
MVTSDASFANLVERSGATMIGYRDLRDLQRDEARAVV